MKKQVSIIIPARNEAAQIGSTLDAALASVAVWMGVEKSMLHLDRTAAEIIVVNNLSTDGTQEMIQSYAERHGVRAIRGERLKAPCARNDGVLAATGDIFIFIDADTSIPPAGIARIFNHVAAGRKAGIFRLLSLEGGLRAWCWWTFWNWVRYLPLPKAKALPAFMFCTREIFDRFGPFDETVVIGEEWPILAGLYRADCSAFIYDSTLTGHSSSRRMERQPFGYTRTFWKYVWAILHVSGRVQYTDTIR